MLVGQLEYTIFEINTTFYPPSKKKKKKFFLIVLYIFHRSDGIKIFLKWFINKWLKSTH